MKLPLVTTVDVVMATKCSTGVSMATEQNVHARTPRRHAYGNHRKSAVELLEASKSEYVKSRQVLNHRQELKHPENLSVGNGEVISMPISVTKLYSEETPTKDPAGIEKQNSNSDDSQSRSPTFHSTSNSRLQSNSTSPPNSRKSSAASSGAGEVTNAVSKKPSPPVPPRRNLPDDNNTRPTSPPKPLQKPQVPPRPGTTVKPVPGPKPSVIQNTPGKPVPPPRTSRPPVSASSVPSDDLTEQSNMAAPGDNVPITVSKSSDSPEQKRFSSVSISATYADSENSGPSSSVLDSRYSLSSQSDMFLKPLAANNLSTSVGVLVERRTPMPKPRIDKQLKEVELPPRRQLHRSQSDLSDCRHSRTSSDFSDLSSRLSRTSTEVERFFNEMGLDRSVLEPMRKLCETRQKECLDSLSSLDSLENHSISSQISNDRYPMESEQDLSERDPGTFSVVERNARIIKWLCNVKKARTVQTRPSRAMKVVEKSTEKKS